MEGWFQEAKCYNMDPTIFFPKGRTGRKPKNENDDDMRRRDEEEKRVAQKICSGCKTVAECLEYALMHDIQGVAGAKSYEERLSIRRRRRIA